ncbi:MAG: SpoIIE family protein phosphatase [Pirellulales bacterium]
MNGYIMSKPSTSEHPFEHDVVVLLVDDQRMVGEGVRRMLAPHEDIAFHYCQDPKEALAKAADLQPTVILQDLVMPDIDGLDLVRDYRRQEATRYTPLIVLSTKEEADTKAEAFARGANDYVVKLPDPVELVARIRYHSRGYIALIERRDAYAALARNEQALREELALAANYVRSLLPDRLEDPVRTDWRFIPSASLGGDAFDYQWLDEDRLAICLIDVCGHGVGSALLSVSAINALRSRTLPDTDFANPSQVLAGLNRAFPMERQNDMFFTMWYGIYDRRTGRLAYAGAGHPPALLVASDTGQLKTLDNEAPMIGIDEDSEFPGDACDVRPGDQLFVYSDGVFEITKAEDEQMWTFAEFLDLMRQPTSGDTSKIDQLLEYARHLQGGDEFNDDFSIVQVVF